MTCGKCGGEYDNTFDKCPYCGEVFKIPGSGKKKRRKFDRKTKKLARFLRITEETAEKIWIVLPAILIAIIGIVILSRGISYFAGAGAREVRTKQKNLVLLERYFDTGEYDMVYETIKGISKASKDEDYINYYCVSLIYEAATDYEKLSILAPEIFGSREHESIKDNTVSAFVSLVEAYRQAEILRVKYGSTENNGSYIDKVMETYIDDCVSTYKLHKNEVMELIKEGGSEESIIMSYADIVYRRVVDEAYITDDKEGAADEVVDDSDTDWDEDFEDGESE